MGTRGIALAAVVGTAALGLGGTAVAAPVGDRFDRAVVRRAVDEMARTGAQGVQVRVVDGRREFTARAGTADARTRLTVSPTSAPDPGPITGAEEPLTEVFC